MKKRVGVGGLAWTNKPVNWRNTFYQRQCNPKIVKYQYCICWEAQIGHIKRIKGVNYKSSYRISPPKELTASDTSKNLTCHRHLPSTRYWGLTYVTNYGTWQRKDFCHLVGTLWRIYLKPYSHGTSALTLLDWNVEPIWFLMHVLMLSVNDAIEINVFPPSITASINPKVSADTWCDHSLRMVLMAWNLNLRSVLHEDQIRVWKLLHKCINLKLARCWYPCVYVEKSHYEITLFTNCVDEV